jgi:hypothetical protein
VKVTADGRLKVLDFGLAKALWNEPATDQAPVCTGFDDAR